MIRNIPTVNDFRNKGIDYLNLGWSAVLNILMDIDDAESECAIDIERKDMFWKAADREITTALTLIQQGAEFLLKSKICEISPWLLISRPPSQWPRKCDVEDIDFSAFRMLDAHDLMQVHNTFAAVRMPSRFISEFEILRRERNVIMHAADQNINIEAAYLIPPASSQCNTGYWLAWWLSSCCC